MDLIKINMPLKGVAYFWLFEGNGWNANLIEDNDHLKRETLRPAKMA